MFGRRCASARSLRTPVPQSGKPRLRLWSLHEARGPPAPRRLAGLRRGFRPPRAACSKRCSARTDRVAQREAESSDAKPHDAAPRWLVRRIPRRSTRRRLTSGGWRTCEQRVRAAVGNPKRRAEVRGNSRSCRISPPEPELRFPARRAVRRPLEVRRRHNTGLTAVAPG